jgi:hypothetical protein
MSSRVQDIGSLPGRSHGKGNRDDRLSSLPDDILLTVLDRCKAPNAARASVLFRRWSQLPAVLSGLTVKVCLVDRPNSEILPLIEICLFVSLVRFSEHCPPHTDTASQPCPLEKLKSSFSTELGWLHPTKRPGGPPLARVRSPRLPGRPQSEKSLLKPCLSPAGDSTGDSRRHRSPRAAQRRLLVSSLARSRESPVPPSPQPFRPRPAAAADQEHRRAGDPLPPPTGTSPTCLLAPRSTPLAAAQLVDGGRQKAADGDADKQRADDAGKQGVGAKHGGA